MTDTELDRFHLRMYATTITNQATLRCMTAGLPVTVDNIILCVGDFVDPAVAEVAPLVDELRRAIALVVSKPSPVRIVANRN